MKRISLILVLALMVFCYPNPAEAQAPPALVSGGAIFQNGGATHFAMQLGGNINVMSKGPVEGTVTKQVYVRAAAFLADDIDLSGQTASELQALSGFAIGEITLGDFFIATGTGMSIDAKEGENPVAPAVLIEGGWKPVSVISFRLCGQYIPIAGAGDLTFAAVAVGISL